MSDQIRRVCVMGQPVSHSRSPMIHGYWLQSLGIIGAYDLKELSPEAFDGFVTHLEANGYVGGNVTVPHKEAAFRLVEHRDAAAEAIGAVNTVWLDRGRLMGGNSDAHGFVTNLDELAPGWQVSGAKAVVMGAGGGARAAVYALVTRGVEVAIVNRSVERAEALATHFGKGTKAYGHDALAGLLPSADLLVNCTSCGMVDKPALAIDLTTLKSSAVVYDIVYVPLETPLLAAARRRGNRTVDGLGMLLQQAGFGFTKWFGITPRVTQGLRAPIEKDIRAKVAGQ